MIRISSFIGLSHLSVLTKVKVYYIDICLTLAVEECAERVKLQDHSFVSPPPPLLPVQPQGKSATEVYNPEQDAETRSQTDAAPGLSQTHTLSHKLKCHRCV